MKTQLVMAFRPSDRFDFCKSNLISVYVTKKGTISKREKLPDGWYIPRRYTNMGRKRLNPVWTTDDVIPDVGDHLPKEIYDKFKDLEDSCPVNRMTEEEIKEYSNLNAMLMNPILEQLSSLNVKRDALIERVMQRPITFRDEW